MIFSVLKKENFLFSEKSGSVAHLVENEIPLSNSVAALQHTEADTKAVLGNLTDSYNNILLREAPPLPTSVQDDESTMQVAHHRPPRLENVYSNVLPTPIGGQSRIQPVPGPLKPLRPAELQQQQQPPTAHVYSNIEEKMHESIEIFLKSVPYRQRVDFNGTGETGFDESNSDDGEDENDDRMTVSDDNDELSQRIEHQGGNSSRVIDDFVNTSGASGKLTLSTSSSSAATAVTQIDLRNAAVRPIKNGLKNGVVVVGGTSNNSNSIGSSNSIENASDLDGSSSIGNNSQSCLVKPAIV